MRTSSATLSGQVRAGGRASGRAGGRAGASPLSIQPRLAGGQTGSHRQQPLYSYPGSHCNWGETGWAGGVQEGHGLHTDAMNNRAACMEWGSQQTRSVRAMQPAQNLPWGTSQCRATARGMRRGRGKLAGPCLCGPPAGTGRQLPTSSLWGRHCSRAKAAYALHLLAVANAPVPLAVGLVEVPAGSGQAPRIKGPSAPAQLCVCVCVCGGVPMEAPPGPPSCDVALGSTSSTAAGALKRMQGPAACSPRHPRGAAPVAGGGLVAEQHAIILVTGRAFRPARVQVQLVVRRAVGVALTVN